MQNYPLLSFGIVADIQYADLPNGQNFLKTQTRHYRKTLEDLKIGIKTWQNYESKIQFIIQLGDIIDGLNKQNGQSFNALNQVLNEFNKLPCKIHHLIGNHELYNFDRKQLKEYLNIDKNYYSFVPIEGFKFIILDSFDESIICPSTGSLEQHQEFLAQNNFNVRIGNHNWSQNVKGEQKRFMPYNGGIGLQQLQWLSQQLNCEEKILIFSHQPLHPKCSSKNCMHWNYKEILQIIQDSNRVVACFGGHFHKNGYFYENNVHYFSIGAPLEQEENAFGIINIFENKIELKGYGIVKSQIINIEQ